MKPNLRKFIIGSAAALLALALSGQARAATLWFYNLTNNIGRIEINQRGPYKLKTDAEAAAERDRQEGLAVSPVFSIEWGLDDALKANAAPAPASPPADNAPAVAANQKPASQTDGPSEQETLEWIQSHISELQFSYSFNMNDTGWSSEGTADRSISSVELKNGDLIIIGAVGRKTYTTLTSDNSHREEGTSSVWKTTVSAGNLLGEVQIVKESLSVGHTTTEPSTETLLEFTSKPKMIVSFSSSYSESEYRGGGGGQPPSFSFKLDDVRLESRLDNFDSEVKRRVINNQGKPSMDSQFSIPVNPDYAERFKKAFDHLIQLHGGGKPEAF